MHTENIIPYVGIIQIRFGLGIHPTLSLLDTQAPVFYVYNKEQRLCQENPVNLLLLTILS